MEHREPSRIGPADGPRLDLGPDEPPRVPSRRFARLVDSPAARRLAVDRIGRALLATATVVGLLIVGGSSLSRSVVAWLHRQKDYQLRFGDIILDPPPPPWIRGGGRTLLESVRDGRKNLETLSILDLDLDRLLTDVRRNPWVARADRATKSHPNRVAVSLTYREPVALVQADSDPPIPVDREGVVLPLHEFDEAKSGSLALIEAEPRQTPPKPGLIWSDDDPPDKSRPSPRVVRAAKLAGRLKDALREVGPEDWSPKSIRALVHEPATKQPNFWVEFDRTFVRWGRFATLDAPGEPSDLDKWRALAAKVKADGGLEALGEGEFLDAVDGMRVRKGR